MSNQVILSSRIAVLAESSSDNLQGGRFGSAPGLLGFDFEWRGGNTESRLICRLHCSVCVGTNYDTTEHNERCKHSKRYVVVFIKYIIVQYIGYPCN